MGGSCIVITNDHNALTAERRYYAHYVPEVLSSAPTRMLWTEEKEGGQALLQGVEHMHTRELTL